MNTDQTLPTINYPYLEDFLVRLLNTPSPTGFASAAVDLVAAELAGFDNVSLQRTKKGALLINLAGAASSGVKRALTAHVDTLGAMVKSIKPSGRLALTNVGGFAWGSVEGEGCWVHTRRNGALRGSLLPNQASVHVYSGVRDEKRSAETMEVRLDARVQSAEDTHNLGIEVGDFVSFDPRVEVHDGFVRSRHLDDKAAVAVLVAVIRALSEAGLQPAQDSCILISNFEEVGFGGTSDFPEGLEELLAVDMAAIGEGQASDEFHATLCVKDSSGPYHHELSEKLRTLADQFQIAYKVDIYPYYGSDAKAYWSGGGSAAIALIGPGVDSSHHYERTHHDALLATANWVLAYLLSA